MSFYQRHSALAVAAILALAAALVWHAAAPASAEDGDDPLPAPAGLQVAAERGSLDVTLDWDDVDGADSYWVRWRVSGPGKKLNEGVYVQSSGAEITVRRYGEWVARVQACDDAGCGAPAAKKFRVKKPRATPEATPEPAPEPTPEPTPDPAPGTLQVSIEASPASPLVNEAVTLAAVIANASSESDPSYAWEVGRNGGWFSHGTDSTLTYLAANAETWSFKVTVTYGSGASATSDPLTVTWADSLPAPTPEPTPEPAPAATPEPAPESTPEPTPAIPGAPAGLTVSAQPGSLDVAVEWDGVVDAAYYWVRWRPAGPENALNQGVTVHPSEAAITVAGYGEWVARAQACNDAGCGGPAVSRFSVEAAPEPTATPTPVPAPSALRLAPALDDEGKLRPLTATANWDPVPDASSHKLRWRQTSGEFQAQDQLTLEAAETSADFTVSQGGEYEVELRSYGDGDNGPIAMSMNQMEMQYYQQGHIISFYTYSRYEFLISGVEAELVHGGIKVTWRNPGRSDITKYQYRVLHRDEWAEYWSDYTSRGWTDAPGTDASTTSYTVTGLEDDEIYAVWLRAATGNKTYRFIHWFALTTPHYVTVNSSTYGTIDYDTDDDGLIEIYSADQLNAMRWDLDSDGAVGADNLDSYGAAFSGRLEGMGCPDSGCIGYEIGTGADGEAPVTIDLNVAPYNTGAGWAPLGVYSLFEPYGFDAILEGNGNVIANLFINRTEPYSENLGLFHEIASGGTVRNLGLTGVNISSSAKRQSHFGPVGALAGRNGGLVSNCYSTGTISISNPHNTTTGGLVGYNRYGKTYASRSSVSVNISHVHGGFLAAGGLAGVNWQGDIAASYATGSVTVNDKLAWQGGVGGLVGRNQSSSLRASYSTGAVTFSSTIGVPVGGLVGDLGGHVWGEEDGTVTDSYYNSETSSQSDTGKGAGKTTAQLQSPTGYTGIYANWNLDLDGDGSADDPWNFGTGSEYPTLN